METTGRVVHKAKLISNDGDVSPLCAKKPRKLNMATESWTFGWQFVTCEKCKAKR